MLRKRATFNGVAVLGRLTGDTILRVLALK